MADRLRNNSRAILSADEVEPGVFVQRVKMTTGPDDTAVDVSVNDPLPVNVVGGGVISGENPYFNDNASFGASSSLTVDFEASYGRKVNNVTVIQDGPGDGTIELSHDGTTFTAPFPVKAGETLVFEDIEIARVRMAKTGLDYGFRVVAS
jgi:hypothetical protein